MQPTRTFQDALACLNSLENNAKARNRATQCGNAGRRAIFDDFARTMSAIGYSPEAMQRIQIVHIAGSKGKGTTATMTASVLRQFQQPAGPLGPIGLFMSPHVRTIRERIQVIPSRQPKGWSTGDAATQSDGLLREDVFAKYFFEVWDLMDRALALGKISARPPFFKFLFALAVHTFIAENVAVAIIECGIGGEFDATNYISTATVSGICRLELEHTDLLGLTVESIAWHKGGIMKPGAPAFTIRQQHAAMNELRKRALEKRSAISVAQPLVEASSSNNKDDCNDWRASNAGLARELALTVLKPHRLESVDVESRVLTGVSQYALSGRLEKRLQGSVQWYIDGAHTVESLSAATQWFCGSTADHHSKMRVLLFNQESRDTHVLLDVVHRVSSSQSYAAFTHVLFCSNQPFAAGSYSAENCSMNEKVHAPNVQGHSKQTEEASNWKRIDQDSPDKVIRTFVTTKEAVDFVLGEAEQVGCLAQCLVTGSMHLVGAVDTVLDSMQP